MHRMHARATPRAFTLIEVLIVITILLILLATSIEGFRSFAVGVGGDASARRVLKTLEEAHARTLSSDGDTQYGVHFETGSATLFVGSTYVSGAGGNEVSTLHRAEISALSLTDGVDDVVFSRIRGTPSATGTIVITQTGDASIERTIHIYETGLSDMEL